MKKNSISKTLLCAALFSSSMLFSVVSHAEKAVFAGGCFWCMEKDFEALEGVSDVVSGFTGGTAENPTYSGDHSSPMSNYCNTSGLTLIRLMLLDNFVIRVIAT